MREVSRREIFPAGTGQKNKNWSSPPAKDAKIDKNWRAPPDLGSTPA